MKTQYVRSSKHTVKKDDLKNPLSNDPSIYIAGFFKGENFHKFHKSIAICENFTLKVRISYSVTSVIISNVLNIMANGQVQGLKHHR